MGGVRAAESYLPFSSSSSGELLARGAAYNEKHAAGRKIGCVVLKDGGVIGDEIPHIAREVGVGDPFAVGGCGP